MEKIKRLNRRS